MFFLLPFFQSAASTLSWVRAQAYFFISLCLCLHADSNSTHSLDWGSKLIFFYQSLGQKSASPGLTFLGVIRWRSFSSGWGPRLDLTLGGSEASMWLCPIPPHQDLGASPPGAALPRLFGARVAGVLLCLHEIGLSSEWAGIQA